MFTSRAEYRLTLRQDNADERLTPLGYKIGLVGEDRYRRLIKKISLKESVVLFCKKYTVNPAMVHSLLIASNTSTLTQNIKLDALIRRPQLSIFSLIPLIKPLLDLYTNMDFSLRNEVFEAAEILIKYSGYIDRESIVADKMIRLEGILIDNKFEYQFIESLSTEARQKLASVRPKTIGQASRIPGVSPSDINVLLVMLGR